MAQKVKVLFGPPVTGTINDVEKPDKNAPHTLTTEAKRESAKLQKEVEHFKGSELLSDKHFDRLAKKRENHGVRREILTGNLKKLYLQAQETPLSRGVSEQEMLRLQNKAMANKITVVGRTTFKFDGNGVAAVPKLSLQDYNALVRRPGYREYHIQKSVETEQVVGVVNIDHDVTLDDLEVFGKNWKNEVTGNKEQDEDLIGLTDEVVNEITKTDEIVEDETTLDTEDEVVEDENEEDDEIDFADYTKKSLLELLEQLKVEHNPKDKKEKIVALVNTLWEEADDEREEKILDWIVKLEETNDTDDEEQ